MIMSTAQIVENYADETCNITRRQLNERTTYSLFHRLWDTDLTGCIIRNCYLDRLFDIADECKVMMRKRSGLDLEGGLKQDFLNRGFLYEPQTREGIVKATFGINQLFGVVNQTDVLDFPFNGKPDFYHPTKNVNVEIKNTRHESTTIPFKILANLEFLEKLGLFHPIKALLSDPKAFFHKYPIFINDLFQLSLYYKRIGKNSQSHFVYVCPDKNITTGDLSNLMDIVYDSMIDNRVKFAIYTLNIAKNNPTPITILFDVLHLWKMELNDPIGLLNSNFCNDCPYRFTHCPALPPIRGAVHEDMERIIGIENFLNSLILLEESNMREQQKDFGLLTMKMLKFSYPDQKDASSMVEFVKRLQIMFAPDPILPDRMVTKVEVNYL